MKVYERVAETLHALGVTQVFGVAGSGNYHVTRALIDRGAAYVSARHEGGAVSMADAYSRMADTLPVVSVHQGGGLTNLITGLTEAAKSGTPLIVLAGEAPTGDRLSNFRVDQEGLARAVGAASVRVARDTATADVRMAVRTALADRTPVVLNFPVDVQTMESPEDGPVPPLQAARPLLPDPADVEAAAQLLLDARAPLIIGGRGARHARDELLNLARLAGGLTATSAVARGLFHGDPYNLDVMGDLASPLTAELVLDSDVIVAFGCGLGRWTTSNGDLLPQKATLVQVDDAPARLGLQRPVQLEIAGDAAATADAIAAHIPEMEELSGKRRTGTNRKRIADGARWPDVPFRPSANPGRIDPRTATIALDGMLGDDKNVAVDSGNFLGYPSMFLTISDARSLCFSQAFQCVGLGLASAIGHAVARPDRLTVAACGDGGLLMGATELETVVRLGLPMVVLVYNDSAYGAEVHHFGRTDGDDGFVTFPDVDFAAVGRGYGFTGATVREEGDLDAVAAWLSGPRDTPLLVDIKVADSAPSWWLADAFKAEG
ncbi:thiamine pyrophosphate-binding protein [Tomitella fengzijianii]|uniref:acetolactate synthase n=1 Tax=Tomitella fengzijianii TaxID=2597660 RepID=A0A516WZE3_9ACTN|nr:thiamine pyrophosphate-binding protein [Tomitella fengzijianii]QDQ96193.1 thiamine pyrophosphate-binding protein [Tomitella fengzijianii]